MKSEITEPSKELRETLEPRINKFMTDLVLDKMQQGYNLFKQNQAVDLYFNFLRMVHITECNQFSTLIDEDLNSESQSARFLKLLNKLFNSNDVKFLSNNKDLYRDILYNVPDNPEEKINLIHEVQFLLKEKYLVLFNTLEAQHQEQTDNSNSINDAELHEVTKLFVNNLMNMSMTDEMYKGYMIFKKDKKLDTYLKLAKLMPTTECDKFSTIVDEYCGAQSSDALFFKQKNKLFCSEDVKYLTESEKIYEYMLSGKLCPSHQPKNSEEIIERIQMIQQVMRDEYCDIILKDIEARCSVLGVVAEDVNATDQ